MPGKLKRLVSHYRKGGTREVLLHLPAHGCLRAPLFSLSLCHVLSLDCLNGQALRRTLNGYHFERGGRANIGELVACQGNRVDTPGNVFAEFFDAGQECFIARKDDAIVAYFWAFKGRYLLRFDDCPQHSVLVTTGENEVFFGNGFINAAHRMRGLFPHLVNFVIGHYPTHVRFFSSVNHTNQPSLVAHRRLGFRPVFSLACMEVFALRFFRHLRPHGKANFLGFGSARIDLDRCLALETPGAQCDERATRGIAK